MITVIPAGADPCAALFGQMKKDCENAAGGSGSTVSTGISLYDLLTKPQVLAGGIRHAYVRLMEVIVGGLLVVIGLNAFVKAQFNVNVAGTATKVAKTAKKVAG